MACPLFVRQVENHICDETVEGLVLTSTEYGIFYSPSNDEFA